MALSILILGNGFDRNLDLRTSYNELIKSPEFQKLLDSGNQLAQYINQIAPSKWHGLEKSLSQYAQDIHPDSNLFLKEYNSLKDTIKQYYLKISMECVVKPCMASDVLISNYIPRMQKPSDSLLIINFNYTNTASLILKAYLGWEGRIINFLENIMSLFDSSYQSRLSHLQMIHPHGSVDNEIVFGVSDSDDVGDYIFLKKSTSKTYVPGFSDSVLNCAEAIVFFGFSLGEPDHHYFENLFHELSLGKQGRKRIVFYYYGEKERLKLMSELDVLTNNHLSKLRMNNDVMFYDNSQAYEPTYLFND
ncbi:MAG: hypothetical protein IKN31_00780 [Bacteroidales bacterium]|nr:hypothetical protein [Bacteroidales bacterium]